MSSGGGKWPTWFVVGMVLVALAAAYAAVFGGLPGTGR